MLKTPLLLMATTLLLTPLNPLQHEMETEVLNKVHLHYPGYAVQFISEQDLTTEMLENRHPNLIIVEKTIGMVLDDEGNGKSLTASNLQFDYIAYKDCETGKPLFNKGNIIETFSVYDPDCNCTDCIQYRYDYRIN